MIISASRRTDIPALYSRWFVNRVQAGFCLVPNPFNPRQVARVSLKREDVDAFVFWTRHPKPLFRWLPLLDKLDYRYYFQYTITGYGRPLEPRAPPLKVALNTFRSLAEMLPQGAVVWRYDPIVLGDAFTPDGHLSRFAAIARELENATTRVVTSVVHVYRKTERRLAALYRWGEDLSRHPAADPRLPAMLEDMVRIATRHGMTVEACAQKEDYARIGIKKSKCVDDRLLSALFGGAWPTAKDPGQRAECRCIPSKDIGMVDTCTFGCRYCYSTRSDTLALNRYREHDQHSPSLIRI